MEKKKFYEEDFMDWLADKFGYATIHREDDFENFIPQYNAETDILYFAVTIYDERTNKGDELITLISPKKKIERLYTKYLKLKDK